MDKQTAKALEDLKALVEKARARRLAADETFLRVSHSDGRAQQNAGAEREEARRELAQLEEALRTQTVAVEG